MKNYFNDEIMYRFVEREESINEDRFSKDYYTRLNMFNKYKNLDSFKVDDNYIGFGKYLVNQYVEVSVLIYKRVKKFIDNIDEDLDLIYTDSFISDLEMEKFLNMYSGSDSIDVIDLITREVIYEVYRSKYYPNLNSRYHSLFLTDKKSLDYWKYIMDNHDLYEVEVSGTYFKTNANLLAGEGIFPFWVYECAKEYWNPDYIDDKSAEYLFKGNVKVLRKI